MILEIATIDVTQGSEEAFIAGVRAARAVFEKAVGWHSLTLQRSIENPSRFHVLIGWDTVENHMVDFRNSPAFGEWRTLVGPFFAATPQVEHVNYVSLD